MALLKCSTFYSILRLRNSPEIFGLMYLKRTATSLLTLDQHIGFEPLGAAKLNQSLTNLQLQWCDVRCVVN